MRKILIPLIALVVLAPLAGCVSPYYDRYGYGYGYDAGYYGGERYAPYGDGYDRGYDRRGYYGRGDYGYGDYYGDGYYR